MDLYKRIALFPTLVILSCSGPQTPAGPGDTPLPTEAYESAADILERGLKQLSEDKIFSAEASVQEIVSVNPSHLEARVFMAMLHDLTSDLPEAKTAWSRVEDILVYRGKLAPFVLQQTLLSAGIHYLKQGRKDRSSLFLDELWRRFPGSSASLSARIEEAELEAGKGHWSQVRRICRDLVRTYPKAKESKRCEVLVKVGARMMAIGPEPAPNAPRWRWQHPSPQANRLNDVLVLPSGAAYAVGDAGTILGRKSAAEPFVPLPRVTRWTLESICAAGTNGAYAVGDGGVVLELSDGSWSVIRRPAAAQQDLFAVHSSAPGQLVAVGAAGTALTLTNGTWDESTITNTALYAVWGPDADTTFAAGKGGLMMERSGGAWKTIKSDTYEDINDIWGSDKTFAVGVGKRRTSVVFNGTSWKESVAGSASYNAIWGKNAGRLWAVGSGGNIILGADAMAWKSEESPTRLQLNGVSGATTREVWAVGGSGVLLRRRANRWRSKGGGFAEKMVGLCSGSRDGEVLVLGQQGTLLAFRRGKWRKSRVGVKGVYTDLWCGKKLAVAVGKQGLMVRRPKRGRWKQVKTGVNYDLLTVRGYGNGAVAVGLRGHMVRLDAQGKAAREKLPTSHDLHSIWVGSDNNVYAVGARGVVLHHDGKSWKLQETGLLTGINGVWGDGKTVIAVGEGGRILSRVRNGWKAMASPTSQNLVGIVGNSINDVVAISERGGVIHFNGKTWTVHNAPAACLDALGIDKKGAYRAVGCNGAIIGWSK